MLPRCRSDHGGTSRGGVSRTLLVMAGLIPAIHVFLAALKTWMPATSENGKERICQPIGSRAPAARDYALRKTVTALREFEADAKSLKGPPTIKIHLAPSAIKTRNFGNSAELPRERGEARRITILCDEPKKAQSGFVTGENGLDFHPNIFFRASFEFTEVGSHSSEPCSQVHSATPPVPSSASVAGHAHARRTASAARNYGDRNYGDRITVTVHSITRRVRMDTRARPAYDG
jgi:hypothetical protein